VGLRAGVLAWVNTVLLRVRVPTMLRVWRSKRCNKQTPQVLDWTSKIVAIIPYCTTVRKSSYDSRPFSFL